MQTKKKSKQSKIATSNITYYYMEQRTPEWFAIKEKYPVSASVADKLLLGGKSRLLQLPKSEFKGNWYTQRGALLEKPAIELYEDITNVKVTHAGFITNTKYPDCGYSPDGLLPDRNIEVKCFNEDKHERSRIEIPFEVMAQVQFGMMIREVDLTDLVLYNPDIKDPAHCLYIVPILKDVGIISHIIRKLGE